MIGEGDTVTGPTASGEVVTGVVTGVFDHDVEGRSYPDGRRLVVLADGRERPVSAADATVVTT